MKKIFTLLPALLFACFFALAQQGDEAAIKKVNEDWLQSYLHKDTATLNRVLADDMFLVTSLGVTLRKKEVFAKMIEPDRKYLAITLDSVVSLCITGKTGILVGKSTIVRTLQNVQSTINNCYMAVFEKRRERWFIIAIHVTVLNSK